MGEVWREGDTYHHVHAKHLFFHIFSGLKVPQLSYSLASNVFIIPSTSARGGISFLSHLDFEFVASFLVL